MRHKKTKLILVKLLLCMSGSLFAQNSDWTTANLCYFLKDNPGNSPATNELSRRRASCDFIAQGLPSSNFVINNSTLQDERKKLEDERRQLAEERRNLQEDNERKKLEYEKLQLAEERRKFEEEKLKIKKLPNSGMAQTSQQIKQKKCIQLGLIQGSEDFKKCIN